MSGSLLDPHFKDEHSLTANRGQEVYASARSQLGVKLEILVDGSVKSSSSGQSVSVSYYVPKLFNW